MGLTNAFENVRGQMLMMDPLPSINKVFSLVIQEEKQKRVSYLMVLMQKLYMLVT